MSKWLETVLTGFIGSIVGACIAYLSAEIREWRKKHSERRGAITRAQFALIAQLNTIDNIRKQHFEQYRDDPERELKLIHFTMEGGDFRVPFEAIAFLLDTPHKQLMLEIHSAEQTFLSALSALKERNQAFETFHGKSELTDYDPVTKRCKVIVKDPRLITLLKDKTDIVYRTMDNAIERLGAQIQELFRAGKSLYPKHNFLKTEPKPKPETLTNEAKLTGQSQTASQPTSNDKPNLMDEGKTRRPQIKVN